MYLHTYRRIKEGDNSLRIVIGYILVMNILGVLVMAVDKRKAVKKKWRIPEKQLFLVSLLGGSIGTLTGMYLFRHKTKHWYFVVGMPLILIIQVAIVVYLSISGKILVFGLNF